MVRRRLAHGWFNLGCWTETPLVFQSSRVFSNGLSLHWNLAQRWYHCFWWPVIWEGTRAQGQFLVVVMVPQVAYSNGRQLFWALDWQTGQLSFTEGHNILRTIMDALLTASYFVLMANLQGGVGNSTSILHMRKLKFRKCKWPAHSKLLSVVDSGLQPSPCLPTIAHHLSCLKGPQDLNGIEWPFFPSHRIYSGSPVTLHPTLVT